MKNRNDFSRDDVIRAAAGMRKGSAAASSSSSSLLVGRSASSGRMVSAGLSAAEINQAYAAAKRRLRAA